MESADITKIRNKNFRLEMSGWYYTLAEAHAFLGLDPPKNKIKTKEKSKEKE